MHGPHAQLLPSLTGRLLSQQRRDLVRSRVQAVNRLHQALMQLSPVGARETVTADKARTLLATVRSRDTYRVRHVAARLTHRGRTTRLHIDATWRWAVHIATAWAAYRSRQTSAVAEHGDPRVSG